MSENRLKNILDSSFFLYVSCSIIFLISIFIRSRSDIGADSAVYLEIGRKIALGGKYYYQFFESNFPISFYFYALQYQIAQLLNISPIILSEVIINIFGLVSICCSAKILKNSQIYQDKATYSIIIISFFLGFFLRPEALELNEFGTKTSLVLLFLYPYISYSLNSDLLSKRSLVLKGISMGLIPCFKPHYLLVILIIEIYKFSKNRSLKFFVTIDKLTMLFIGISYLSLMAIFTPEFFKYMIPMWSSIYPSIADGKGFMDKFLWHLATRISPFLFIFLIFAKIKFKEDDKILFLIFISAGALLILENISTFDQVALFFAIISIPLFTISLKSFSSGVISFSKNKFIILSIFLIPIFEIGSVPFLIYTIIFGIVGIINIFWLLGLIYPAFFLQKERKYFLKYYSLYFFSLALIFITAKEFGMSAAIALNLFAIFFFLFFFEKKIAAKESKQLSSFSTFAIISAIALLSYSYDGSIYKSLASNSNHKSPSQFSDMVHHYSATYAPEKEDGILMVSTWIASQFPNLNYLEKINYQKHHVMNVFHKFDKNKNDSVEFTNRYLFDDFMSQINNEKIKLVFIDNTLYQSSDDNLCKIGYLESYLRNKGFREVFFKNFAFKNRFIQSKKVDIISSSNFSEIKNSQKIIKDFEIYVRK